MQASFTGTRFVYNMQDGPMGHKVSILSEVSVDENLQSFINPTSDAPGYPGFYLTDLPPNHYVESVRVETKYNPNSIFTRFNCEFYLKDMESGRYEAAGGGYFSSDSDHGSSTLYATNWDPITGNYLPVFLIQPNKKYLLAYRIIKSSDNESDYNARDTESIRVTLVFKTNPIQQL